MKKTNFTFLKKQTLKLMLLGCLFQLTNANSAFSQCSLACNGTTNVSLDDASCEALITVGMVADTSGCDIGGTFEVSLYDALGQPVPGALVTSDYVGQTLEVHVTHSGTNNSCWGWLVIEDKLPPTIVCPTSVDPIYCYQLANYEPLGEDNCGTPYLIKTDSSEVTNNCTNGLGDEVIKVVTQTWIAVDGQGLESEPCTVVIEVLRLESLSEIKGPPSYLWISDNALDCDGVYPKNAAGFPSPVMTDPLLGPGTGVPVLYDTIVNPATGMPFIPLQIDTIGLYPNPFSVCNILVTYSDVELFPDDCVTKIMRTWNVIEWSCSDEQRTYSFIQMIEIVDDEDPTVSGLNDMTETTNTHDCQATVILPPAILNDNCTTEMEDFTVIITHEGTELMTSNGGPTQLGLGDNMVIYTVYDKCGNFTKDTIEVKVEDLTPPVTICDQYTTVALTSDGYAWVHASVFDDGSYDECSPVTLTVKRMDDGVPCDNVDGDEFSEYVRFCCADQLGEIMVIMRAEDSEGNVNDCMVNVTVQDKLAPEITCPAPMTVNCDFAFDPNNLNQAFGTPVISDNCLSFDTLDVLSGTLNQCNIGTLTRTISVGVPGTQNYDVCTQLITFTSNDTFNIDGTDIDWPDDVNMDGCLDPNSTQFLPDNLPTLSQYPTYSEGACDLVGANYDDQIFPFNNQEGDACFKIVRTWTVIDWCQFEVIPPGSTYYKKWSHVQIIKVNDPIAPEITSSCDRVTVCTYDAECLDGPIQLGASATDNCTDQLKWTYMIDVDNTGTFDPLRTKNGFGNTLDASGTYPVGSHRILYSFEDKCGNITSCEQLFDVVNCKAPTPYCLNGLAVDLMPVDTNQDGEIDGGSVVLWATDFDAGSSHSCYDTVYISFDPVFFSETGNTTLPNGMKIEVNNGKEFTCETLGDQSVDIYAAIVTPEDSIIQAYCTTFVNVQDNMGACQGMKAEIDGSITTVAAENLINAEVELIGSELEISMTNAEGNYAFPSMPYGGQYIVKPVKNDDYTNGVSTLDLVMIQRHILGIESLDSPYKVVAADINNDEKIASSDLLLLRKLILGTIHELPNSGSWRFIDASFEFVDPMDAFATPLPENYNIATLHSDMTIDFVALKVGDVNNNALSNLQSNTTSTRSSKSVELSIENQVFATGNLISVPVIVNNEMNTTGMQFTIEVNSELEFNGLTSGIIDVKENNIGFSKLSEGLIAISWNNPEGITLNSEDVLFEINFSSVGSGEVADHLNVTSTLISAEMYDDNLETYAIDFIVKGRDVNTTAFVLHQNTPNPFGVSTVISFELPETLSGSLTVFDVTGKMLTRVQKKFEKGLNQISLDRNQLNASGVMYYQLEAGQYFASKKMIMID